MPPCLAANRGAGSHLERGHTWSGITPGARLYLERDHTGSEVIPGAGVHLERGFTWILVVSGIVAASAAASGACLTPTATILN